MKTEGKMPDNLNATGACESPTRVALAAIKCPTCQWKYGEEYRDSTPCGTCDKPDGPRAALAAPCPCAGMREQLERARFAPIGDNHHNAAKCPYCAAQMREDWIAENNALRQRARDAEETSRKIRADPTADEAEASKLLEYARTVKGSRDVHSIYEVLDLVPQLRAQLAASQERERELTGGSVGVARIAAERQRQISVEGWTPEHDDEHQLWELTRAAMAYVRFAVSQACSWTGATSNGPRDWPWKFCWWKPSPDPIRNLEKAAALIAAEIDRLTRANDKAAAALATPEGTRNQEAEGM